MNRLEELRTEISRLNREITALQSAPLPPNEVEAAVKAWLDDVASNKSLYAYEELSLPGGAGAILEFDPSRFLLNLFRSEIESRLTGYLQGVTSDAGLPAAKRQKEIAKLIAQRRALAVQEELAILAREDATGEDIARRPDADAELIADTWHEHLDEAGRLKLDDAA